MAGEHWFACCSLTPVYRRTSVESTYSKRSCATDLHHDRAERLAIERGENEGMPVCDTEQASCDTRDTEQSHGMAKR
jgi:hypothetical protein